MELAEASAAGGDGMTLFDRMVGAYPADQTLLAADGPLLDITVPGTPKGAKRHRVAIRGKGENRWAQTYHDDDHIAAEERIRRAAADTWGSRPKLDEPLVLEITTWHLRPSDLKKKRDASSGPRPVPRKPDSDNLAKLVMDAITKAGVWADDNRVSDLVVRKRYLPLDERSVEVGVERTEVRVRRAG
jgi:Holliday junction resolvase RusA-like endonuclease